MIFCSIEKILILLVYAKFYVKVYVEPKMAHLLYIQHILEMLNNFTITITTTTTAMIIIIYFENVHFSHAKLGLDVVCPYDWTWFPYKHLLQWKSTFLFNLLRCHYIFYELTYDTLHIRLSYYQLPSCKHHMGALQNPQPDPCSPDYHTIKEQGFQYLPGLMKNGEVSFLNTLSWK